MSGGKKSGSSKPADGTNSSLRCSSIVVTTSSGLGGLGFNGHNNGQSESLPAPQCELTVPKSAGIRAGHRWTIRHEEWDYGAFRRDYGGRYLEDGGDNGDGSHGCSGNDGGNDSNRLLVFQTRPDGASPSKRFECRLLSSASSRQQQQQRVARFVRTLVKMHEKWRAKHPGKAQRLVVDANSASGSGSARSGSARSAARVGRGGIGGNAGGVTPSSTSSSGMHRERRERLRQIQMSAQAGGGAGSGGGRITQLVVAARRKGATGSTGSSTGISSGSRKRKKANDDDAANDDDDANDDRKGRDTEEQDTDGTDGLEQPMPMDLVDLVVNTDDDEKEDAEEMASSTSKTLTKSKSKSKPDHLNLRVDTNTSEAEAEALLFQTAAEKSGSGATSCATTTTTTTNTTAAAGDSKGGNGKSSNKSKAKAKTVTPTPTASTASRKEQQTQQQASQQQQQQPGILQFFGKSNAGTVTAEKKTEREKEEEAADSTTAVANADAAMDTDADADGNRNDDTRKVDGTNDGSSNENNYSGDEDGGNNEDEERNPKMDTTADGESNSDGSSDDVMDVTGHQPKFKSKSNLNFFGSPSRTNSSTNAAKLNRRRNTTYGRNRPSASSRARGGIDHGLVRARSPPDSNGGRGGGIGPPSKKKRQTEMASTTSSLSVSVNEDPYTFDDGKPTPTSYLSTTDLTSRLMGGSSTPNRTYGRNRSSSALPSKRSPGNQRLFPSKSPRNATPLSRIGPTSIFDRPVGGRHFGGKELLAQQKRAEEEEPISDEDEYQRAGDQSDDDDATVAIDDDRSWDANGEASIPSTPPTVRRTGYNSESIMPGRLPHSRRGGRSQDDYGSPVRRRDTSVAHSRRSPQSWGSALRATAKKSTGIVREAPFDNFGNSPDTLGAVRKLDDRFGRCESPMKEDNDDGLYDTDDERARKKMKRLANNPYRSPGSRIHNRDSLENEQQSRYFNDHQMSTADSALLPRGPMRGGLGRGRRLQRHQGHSMRARGPGRHGDTPYQQRARRGQDYYSGRNSSDRTNSYSDRKKPSWDFFNRRGRNGFDRAAERAKNNVATGLRNLGNTW